MDKGMDRKEKQKRDVKLVEELWAEDIATYKKMLCMKCETFEEMLTAIGPVITKTADRKTIMNYHTRGQTRKTISDYHEEFEAQNEW